MSAARRPQCVVIAGPNGAGKTSAAPILLRDIVGIDAFVNADVIAAGLSGFRPESAAFEAGRIMLRRITDLVRARLDLAFESTLSGRSAARLLTRAVRDGYDVHVFYLWLPSADLAVARVRGRVAEGGHDVPEVIVRRRFRKSLVNFDHVYRPIATTWRLYDGSAPARHVIVAHGTAAGAVTVVEASTWREVERQTMEAA
jgi:predicted ABC-type ATPase